MKNPLKKQKSKPKFDSKPVYDFLKSIDDFQFRLLEVHISIASKAQQVIKAYSVSKQEFCEAVHIKPAQYTAFVKGNFNYTVKDTTYLNYFIQTKVKQDIDKSEYVMEYGGGNKQPAKSGK